MVQLSLRPIVLRWNQTRTLPMSPTTSRIVSSSASGQSAIQKIPDPLPFTGGNCFLLAPASTYALRDNPRTRARSFCEAAPKNGSNVIHYGGGGVPTTIISGWFSFSPVSIKPLKRLLPELILVKADQHLPCSFPTFGGTIRIDAGKSRCAFKGRFTTGTDVKLSILNALATSAIGMANA